jgi:hypothetical protein
MQCRICLETDDINDMISPCGCRGSALYIHRDCLDDYIRYYPSRRCSVCNQSFYIRDTWRLPVLLTFLLLLVMTLLRVNILWGFKLLIGFGLYVFVSLAQRFLTSRICLLLTATLLLGWTHPMWMVVTVWVFLARIVKTHDAPVAITLFLGGYLCMFLMAVATVIDPYLAILIFVPVETLMLTIF